MKLKQTKLPRRTMFISLAVFVMVIMGVFSYFYFKPKSHTNTVTQNRELEIKAFQQNDPTICSQIKGNSYTFGGSDGEIDLNQAQAQQDCRQNIQKGIEPELIAP